ncbi:MAG: putative hydrolase [Alphaproteobacteria bacterium]|nr:MAG: putative hydrolase [Alphaproteobacteria bacterium]
MQITRRRMLGSVALTLTAPSLASACATPLTPNGSSEWTTHEVASSTDGARIVYHVAGEGPPLVIVHGGSTTSAPYRPLADLLKDRYRVALLERRNYGISEQRLENHTFEQDGADAISVARRLGREVYLFGHSGGALSALHGARAHPEAVRALALYEPPLTAGGRIDAILAEIHRLQNAGQTEEAIIYGYIHIVGLPEAAARQYMDARRDFLMPLAAGSISDVEALAIVDSRPDSWRSVSMPTLLIEGELSAPHPLRDSMALLRETLPRNELITLAGQGHSATAAAPELVARTLADFFVAH